MEWNLSRNESLFSAPFESLLLIQAKNEKAPVGCFPFFGGPGGIRTHDLRVANAALSQLSYKPFIFNCRFIIAPEMPNVNLFFTEIEKKIGARRPAENGETGETFFLFFFAASAIIQKNPKIKP